jgi:hypothetical protein
MNKLLIRIVFLLYILLPGSQGAAFAHNGQTAGSELAVKALAAQHDVALNSTTDADTATYKTSLAPHQKMEKIDSTDSEEEEESQAASKKVLVKKQTVAAAHYFQAAFSIATPQYNTIKKRTDNFPRFSYSIANRWYILFRVIRI